MQPQRELGSARSVSIESAPNRKAVRLAGEGHRGCRENRLSRASDGQVLDIADSGPAAALSAVQVLHNSTSPCLGASGDDSLLSTFKSPCAKAERQRESLRMVNDLTPLPSHNNPIRVINSALS